MCVSAGRRYIDTCISRLNRLEEEGDELGYKEELTRAIKGIIERADVLGLEAFALLYPKAESEVGEFLRESSISSVKSPAQIMPRPRPRALTLAFSR
ncbi:MAG TPA: hypothetical protein P5274_01455 [Candidatus Paceibacterota bacterium]|nr:hypothetical protein [Candidatus Paceibacterota bacterium]